MRILIENLLSPVRRLKNGGSSFSSWFFALRETRNGHNRTECGRSRERIDPRIAHFHVSRTFLSNVRFFHAWRSQGCCTLLSLTRFRVSREVGRGGWGTRRDDDAPTRSDTARNFYSQVASDSEMIRSFREKNDRGGSFWVLIEKGWIRYLLDEMVAMDRY